MITSLKDIIFVGKDLYNEDSIPHIQDNDHSNLISLLNNNQNKNFDDNLNYTSNIDLSCNVQCDEKNNISQSCYQEINQEIEIFTQKRINPSVFASYQSLERYFNIQSCTQQNTILNNYIIQDSDQEYSSSSDMFRDSLESQNKINDRETYKLVEENNLINDKSAEKFSLLHSKNNSVSKTLMEMKDNIGVFPHDNDFSVNLFNKEYSLCKRNCNKLRNQLTCESIKSNKHAIASQSSDLDFDHESFIISSNHIENACSPQKDSAYDTYQLSGECISISNYIESEKSIFSGQKIDKITPRQKDPESNTHDLEFLTTDMNEKDWILNRDQQLCLSCEKSDNSTNSVKSYTRKRHSQKYSLEECEESRGKRKRLKSIHRLTVSEVYKEKEKKISSEWLKFIFDTLNVDDVAFESAKMILSIFRNERIGKLYMRKRCWKDTLEEQALNAILDFCDISEVKNKTNAYTREIVQIMTSILDENIEDIRLNKVN